MTKLKKSLKILGAAVLIVAVFLGKRNLLDAQPTACLEDSQCSSGFFCDENAHFCRECILCEDLKRESPAPRDACIKSIVDCGDCLSGFVKGMDHACVQPDEQVSYTSKWIWIGFCVFLFTLLVILSVVYHRKIKNTINSSKMYLREHKTSLSGNGVGVHQSEGTQAPAEPVAAYQAPSCSPQPSAPPMSAPPLSSQSQQFNHTEEFGPPPPYSAATEDPNAMPRRETSGNQEANVFDTPSYVRLPNNSVSDQTDEEEDALLHNQHDQVDDAGPRVRFPPNLEDARIAEENAVNETRLVPHATASDRRQDINDQANNNNQRSRSVPRQEASGDRPSASSAHTDDQNRWGPTNQNNNANQLLNVVNVSLNIFKTSSPPVTDNS